MPSVLDKYADMPQWPKWRRENIHRFADANGTPAETLCLMSFADRYERGEFNPSAPQPPKPKQKKAVPFDLERFARNLGAETGRIIKGAITPVKALLEALEKDVAERIGKIEKQLADFEFNDNSGNVAERIASIETRASELKASERLAVIEKQLADLDFRESQSGRDGRDGKDGQPGVPGRDGKDGEPGCDGKNGEPGFGLEDFTFRSDDGGRTLVLSFARGERMIERSVTTDIVIDRGVWQEKQQYVKGDGVTWKGSFWIAQRDATHKPDEMTSDWRLAVKRGRDGKDMRT